MAFCHCILSLRVVEDNVLHTMQRMTGCSRVKKTEKKHVLYSVSIFLSNVKCRVRRPARLVSPLPLCSTSNSPLPCSTFFHKYMVTCVCKQGAKERYSPFQGRSQTDGGEVTQTHTQEQVLMNWLGPTSPDLLLRLSSSW